MTGKHAKPDDDRSTPVPPPQDMTEEYIGRLKAEIVRLRGQVAQLVSVLPDEYLDPSSSPFAKRYGAAIAEHSYAIGGPFTPEQVDLITGGEPAQSCLHPKYETDSDNETGLWYCGDCGEPWAGNPPKPVFRAGGEPAAAAPEQCEAWSPGRTMRCDKDRGHGGSHMQGEWSVWSDEPVASEPQDEYAGSKEWHEFDCGSSFGDKPHWHANYQPTPGSVWQDRNPKPGAAT